MATFSGTLDTNISHNYDNQSRLVLILDTITDFEDTVGNFDSPSGNFDLGGTDATSNPNYYTANINSSGYYTFANTLTLDAIYDATFQVELTMESDDPYDLFDSGRGASLFDNAKAPFDGNAPTNNNAIIQIGADDTALSNITFNFSSFQPFG